MKKIFFILIIIFTNQISQGQDFSHQSPTVPYRSKQNPYYWKNNPPNAAYWQQDVHYTIKATIDDKKDIIDGQYFQLVYWNNSPFDLKEMYFHLHNNAFVPGSHYHALNQANDIKVTFGENDGKGLGTTYENLRVNGEEVKTQLDNTILKVFLNTPLKSGDSLVVTMNFKTYFGAGSMRNRMKKFDTFNTKQFDGVHWYPAVTVYDHKFGWSTEQHLDKEFYYDFGAFDIELTLPQEYIVEATGVLLNKEEVLPDSLRKKIDLTNFAKKPYNEAPTVIIPHEDGKTKTWKYHAKNVHNFAWTADPLYRISELEWNGIKVVTIAQEPHASLWQQSGKFTLDVIKIYSRDFGMYAWPKVVVADAKDGMEYPMLTLDNGTYPSHQGLLAHEVGHMWFYGMVGSNETYRAFLDEGFTQFLTVWSMDRIVGEKRARFAKSKFITKYVDSSDTRYENLYYSYFNHVLEGYDEPLNTHSSGFNGAIRHGGNYGLVYYKTGVMLYNLRYVLGNDLFLGAMQHYFNKWKFAHPYPEDFRDAIIEYTQVDLNWFFDQWLETTKYIDYSIKDIDKDKSTGKYKITFERKGRMQMPIDFTVTAEDGKIYKYHIPNTWFIKKTDATVLPKWYGWDLLHQEYIAEIDIPSGIKKVEIDPEHYLADIDLTNNVKGKPGISTWQFDHHVPNLPIWSKSRNYIRPDIWYHTFDGFQIGPHINGSYFEKYSYNFTGWINTRLLQRKGEKALPQNPQLFAFDINSRIYLNKIWKGTNLFTYGSYNAGIITGQINLEKTFRKQDQKNPEYSKIFISTKYLINDKNYKVYLPFPGQWGHSSNENTPGLVNGTINLGYIKAYSYQKGNGEYTFNLRVPSLLSDYNYSYLNLNSINRFNLGKFEFKTRVFGQAGFGNFPLESALYLATGSPEALLDNRFTRARGFFPYSWLNYQTTTNHFTWGGGLNLRGYTGYLAPQIEVINNRDTIVFSYQGTSGASVSGEIDFDKFIKIQPKGFLKILKIDTYLFGDAGIINYKASTQNFWGSLRADAGLGSAFTFKFSPYDIKSVTVRVDFPLFVNRPPAVEKYFDFRYVIAINRSF